MYKRIVGFDVARVFSIVWIVAIYHVLPHANLPQIAPVKTITYSSLSIFTFLSAFLLASRYKFENRSVIIQFYKKRVLRFYPLFFLSSVILCIIGYNSLFSTAKGLLGLSPFWKPHPTTMWYCAMLISLYLLTPYWSIGGIKKQILRFLATMGVIIIVELAFHTVVPRTFFYYPVYFCGIVVAEYGYKRFMSIVLNPKYGLFFFLIYAILLIIELFLKSEILIITNSGIGILALLSIYMLIGNFISKSEHSHVVSVFVKMSYATMCVYLFHREVQFVLLQNWQPINSLLMMLYVGLFGLILSFLVSYYIQLLYDRSLNKFST
jgi:hypothetical protein